ncbi:MAG: polysaccharide deacetylase family protein [Symploca sp. SIO1C4]|uniref:Polysaccharide deacetylase family protein n=1 Tax=Symploca sp. SIO1C4 TaxID=2607765 RepID=A0A6B3N9R8_9CYAN|nr:polysaccharide deacetylase family protein [Symploca sp. SIO1C4]NET05517.1 polysaccharide deacetylase family protein [Symploca sp. SIO2B6]
MAGVSVPLVPLVNQKTVTKETLLESQQQLELSISEITPLIEQQQEAYQQLIAKLPLKTEKELTFSVPEQFQGKTIYQVGLNSKDKIVALTFDDGPWPKTTNEVLYILKKHNIKATFFVLGTNVKNYSGRLKQIVEHGHAIGNHSWSHPYSYQNPSAAALEIDRTEDLLYKISGVKTSLFRPPGGFLNNGLAAYARKTNHAVVLWSSDSRDYYTSEQKLLNNVLKQAQSGGIILLHDGGGDRSKTVRALPTMITELKQRGYKFVTVPELLEIAVTAQ